MELYSGLFADDSCSLFYFQEMVNNRERMQRIVADVADLLMTYPFYLP